MLFSIFFAFFPLISGAQGLEEQFPWTESAIEKAALESVEEYQKELDAFLNVPKEKRTFENTIRAWDMFNGSMTQFLHFLHVMESIGSTKSLRDSAQAACNRLQKFQIETLGAHPEIFEACIQAGANSSLNEQERYYLKNLLLIFRKKGMGLSGEDRKQFAKISQELTEISSQFNRNIAEDTSALFASKQELVGLEEGWLQSRPVNEKGDYRLVCDLPTYTRVMEKCAVQKTRKAMHELYVNRAYPANEELIKELIAKKNQLAKLLGYNSFPELDLSTQMAGSPERVKAFLQEVKERADQAALREFVQIAAELPKGITLTQSGQIERYDEFYAFRDYKEKHFTLDPQKIAEYFPLESTIDGLIRIYERFFNLSIQKASHSLPLPDLQALEVRKQSGELLGVILLDLFPREGKCSHAGVCYNLMAPYSPQNGPDYPALSLILANFSKPLAGQPSLLRHGDVITFFHEFGHAIHSVLGRNEFYAFSGYAVKYDFVELPSQLLEKWMWDPAMLKLISSHYKTGEPLTDEMIQNMLRARDFGYATRIQRTCFLSKLALEFFTADESKNPTAIVEQIWAEELPFSSFARNDHFHNSWMHIPGYGPKFYSYLWTDVYACDLFEKIKREGLLNPEAGASYAEYILKPGGSRDPEQMLIDFLGRKPSSDAFFRQFKY